MSPEEDEERWQNWLGEVASLLSVDPDVVLDAYYQAKELLYEGGASPREAADFIRLYGS
jgi:hypothetical protein